jgi:hypothetical protein
MKWFKTVSRTAVLGIALCGACERQAPVSTPQTARAEEDPRTGSAAASLTWSPSQTIEHIRQCRRDGRLIEIEAFLLPDQRAAVLDHLMAVDDVVTAHRSLNQLIRERIGVGSASTFDADALANIVGVFSRDLEVVDETIDGDRATVTICVAGRLPLDRVEMLRREERWVIRTDPPVPALTDELRKLAQAARRVTLELRTRNLTTDDLQRELRLRQKPILERILELDQAPPNAAS